MVRSTEFALERWARKAESEMVGMSNEARDGTRAYARKQATMFGRQSEALEKRFSEPLEEAAKFLKEFGLDGLVRGSE